jgi:hypothetical protein
VTQIQRELEDWRAAERALQRDVDAAPPPWFIRLALRYVKVRVAKLTAAVGRARAFEDDDTIIEHLSFDLERQLAGDAPTLDLRLPD